MAENRCKFALGGTLCCLLLIPSIFLFAFSFGVVEVLTVGIIWDKQTMIVEYDELYQSGRHWTGLDRYYIPFPSNVQTLRFGEFSWFHDDDKIAEDQTANRGDIECRAADGMQVFMEVTVQYKLSTDPQDLVCLYRDFGEGSAGYREYFADLTTKVVLDVASTYVGTEFFTKRSVIEADIHKALDVELRRTYARVSSLQLVNMEFDKAGAFADAIENTQIANQDVQQQRNEVEVAIINGDALSGSAQTTAAVVVAVAKSKRDVMVQQATADAAAVLFNAQVQVDAYNKVKVDLQFTSNKQLLAHLWMQSVNNDAQKVAMNMPYPDVLKSLSV